MKKNNILLFSILFISISSISCSNKDETTSFSVDLEEYTISPEDEFYDIVFSEDGYSFEDLDSFYKKIKVTRKADKNYCNLRETIIDVLYMKGLINLDDKTVVEYYVNELIDLPMIADMQMFSHLLLELRGHWELERLQEVASTISVENTKYIRENFSNHDEILNSDKQREGMLSLWNIMSLN